MHYKDIPETALRVEAWVSYIESKLLREWRPGYWDLPEGTGALHPRVYFKEDVPVDLVDILSDTLMERGWRFGRSVSWEGRVQRNVWLGKGFTIEPDRPCRHFFRTGSYAPNLAFCRFCGEKPGPDDKVNLE